MSDPFNKVPGQGGDGVPREREPWERDYVPMSFDEIMKDRIAGPISQGIIFQFLIGKYPEFFEDEWSLAKGVDRQGYFVSPCAVVIPASIRSSRDEIEREINQPTDLLDVLGEDKSKVLEILKAELRK